MQIDPAPPLSLAVLVSGSGTTLANLAASIRAGTLHARIGLAVASRPGIAGIARAAEAGAPCRVVERKAFADVATFSAKVFDAIDACGADLIVMAGWLCLLEIPPRYAGRVVNIHPSLLPAFGGHGMYGRKVHEAVLRHGCRVSGCTVHFVDGQYDNGPIIVQRACPVAQADTPETLAARVFEEEKIAYPQAIALYQQGKLRIEGRRVIVLGDE